MRSEQLGPQREGAKQPLGPLVREGSMAPDRGKSEVALENIGTDFKDKLLEARKAGPYGKEKSDGLVVEITTWRQGTRLTNLIGRNPSKAFHVVLVRKGEGENSRIEAVALGTVSGDGNTIEHLHSVEGVVASSGEIKGTNVIFTSEEEARYPKGPGLPRTLDKKSEELLTKRGCPPELIDKLKELFKRGYSSQDGYSKQKDEGLFLPRGVFFDPATGEYVLRGGMERRRSIKEFAWRYERKLQAE